MGLEPSWSNWPGAVFASLLFWLVFWRAVLGKK